MTDPAPHTPPSTEDEPQGEARADTVGALLQRAVSRNGGATALLFQDLSLIHI